MGLIPFLKTALKDMRRVGAVMPSSRFAVRRILRQVPADARFALEYGPGDGVLTRELLKRLPPDGRILAIETNDEFVGCLRRIQDSRLTVVHGDARLAAAFARQHGFAGFDLALSGIPFSLLPGELRRDIVSMTHDLLRSGGVFVVYQTSPLMVPYLKRQFGVKTSVEPLNVPPYFVMRAERAVRQ